MKSNHIVLPVVLAILLAACAGVPQVIVPLYSDQPYWAGRVAQELQDHAFMDLELHPAVQRHMGGYSHQHDQGDDQL